MRSRMLKRLKWISFVLLFTLTNVANAACEEEYEAWQHAIQCHRDWASAVEPASAVGAVSGGVCFPGVGGALGLVTGGLPALVAYIHQRNAISWHKAYNECIQMNDRMAANQREEDIARLRNLIRQEEEVSLQFRDHIIDQAQANGTWEDPTLRAEYELVFDENIRERDRVIDNLENQIHRLRGRD